MGYSRNIIIMVNIWNYIRLATGAFVKPYVKEKGLSKVNYKNFKYTLEYKGCANSNSWDNVSPNTSGKETKSKWDDDEPKQEIKQDLKLNYTVLIGHKS